VRVPGRSGVILRCAGPLCVATMEALRRELTLLRSLPHSALILNITACDSLDREGIRVLLETLRQLRQDGRDLVVVTAGAPSDGSSTPEKDVGFPARPVRPATWLPYLLEVDPFLRVFATEAAATQALQKRESLPS
jgi:hypothetical protein